MYRESHGPLRPDLALERIVREESGRVLATLIGLLGDFDRAEEALQDACAIALARPSIPERRRTIDRGRTSVCA